MTKTTAQQRHALITYFIGKFEVVFGRKPVVNRNKSLWGFESILMDYSPSQARELIDYYVEHYDNPNIEWFLYNYEKIDVAKQESMQNEVARSKRRQATKERLEEWNKRWKK